MAISISPLNLKLDKQNPRFVVIGQEDEAAIRKYMATYEDVCQLAEGINNLKGLLLGERIVVIQEEDGYIVMEGNRRTCALQFLLDRDLIPNGFQHKIPIASDETLTNIQNIEVDVALDRNYAITLMSKRHIDGVKNWKPLAKKRFFASMFMNGNTIGELSVRTGDTASAIRKDIRDYKFLLAASSQYKQAHPRFDEDLISIKIDPFVRIFSAKQEVSPGLKEAPSTILKIYYDEKENTKSHLPGALFETIVQMVFKATIVDREITTRNTLFDVNGVRSLLESVYGNPSTDTGQSEAEPPGGASTEGSSSPNEPNNRVPNESSATNNGSSDSRPAGSSSNSSGPTSGSQNGSPSSSGPGGPTGGGAAPTVFFEHISWGGKLIPGNRDHEGLIVALDELFRMSGGYTRKDGQSLKIYYAYPVAAGMLLRAAYEQALILQLKKIGLWNSLKAQFPFPMLSNIETHVQSNINSALPNSAMKSAFNRIKSASSREFLNANIHNPGLIRTTSHTLEGLANGGMTSLIQLIIDTL